MSFETEDIAVSTLRAVSYRLTNLLPKQLPKAITLICNSLGRCRAILAAPQAGSTNALVHKFRTQVSSLLQDRSIEGRWAAVVLIKAVIENGGLETLQI